MVGSLAVVRFHASWRGGINIHISRGTTLKEEGTAAADQLARFGTKALDPERERMHSEAAAENWHIFTILEPPLAARSARHGDDSFRAEFTLEQSTVRCYDRQKWATSPLARTNSEGSAGMARSTVSLPPHGCSSFPQSPKKEREERRRGERVKKRRKKTRSQDLENVRPQCRGLRKSS